MGDDGVKVQRLLLHRDGGGFFQHPLHVQHLRARGVVRVGVSGARLRSAGPSSGTARRARRWRWSVVWRRRFVCAAPRCLCDARACPREACV